MNAEQIAKLKELAQAATPGPWERGGGKGGGCDLHVYGEEFAGAAICGMDKEYNFTSRERRIQNLDFIAAANPATVLELIALAERTTSPVSQMTEGKMWTAGNSLTLSQDEYPGMGAYFAQVWDGASLVARVYGNSFDEVRERQALIVAQFAAPATQQESVDGPDFQAFVADLVNEQYDNYLTFMAKFIAHIDAHTAAAVAKARQEGYQLAHDDLRETQADWTARARKSEKALAQANASEAKLEAIRETVKSLVGYGDEHASFISRANVLALFEPEPQSDESGLPG